MPRGGWRPGAGRKKAVDGVPAQKVEVATQEPKVIKAAIKTVKSGGDVPAALAFLDAVMRNDDLDIRYRVDAAKAVLPYQAEKVGDSSKTKKEERDDRAKAASGKFSAAAPPLLRSVR